MLAERWFERFERALERRLRDRVEPTLVPGEHFLGGAGFTNRGATAEESHDPSVAASSVRTASELAQHLGRRVALACTDQRLVFYSLKVGLFRVVPKDGLIECPVHSIGVMSERREGQTRVLELRFADGTTLELEGPRHADWSRLLLVNREILAVRQTEANEY